MLTLLHRCAPLLCTALPSQPPTPRRRRHGPAAAQQRSGQVRAQRPKQRQQHNAAMERRERNAWASSLTCHRTDAAAVHWLTDRTDNRCRRICKRRCGPPLPLPRPSHSRSMHSHRRDRRNRRRRHQHLHSCSRHLSSSSSRSSLQRLAAACSPRRLCSLPRPPHPDPITCRRCCTPRRHPRRANPCQCSERMRLQGHRQPHLHCPPPRPTRPNRPRRCD